jgi:hypothetical protein
MRDLFVEPNLGEALNPKAAASSRLNVHTFPQLYRFVDVI